MRLNRGSIFRLPGRRVIHPKRDAIADCEAFLLHLAAEFIRGKEGEGAGFHDGFFHEREVLFLAEIGLDRDALARRRKLGEEVGGFGGGELLSVKGGGQ